MLKYVDSADFNQRHLTGLANSVLAAPSDRRLNLHDLIQAITKGQMRLFEWDRGIVLVGQRDQRLILWGLSADSLLKDAPQLTEDLKRLAADWQCDTIETTCFDPRLTCVIKKLGGRVESTTLALAVE